MSNCLQSPENLGNHYKEATGAKIRGIYYEGPYFTETFKGPKSNLYGETRVLREFHSWQDAAKGMLNKIAIAPERDGVEDFVRTITGEGVTVALGHSDAII